MKILVVHREVSVLNQVKSVLSDSETLVRFYSSGLDGLLAIRVEKFDLIICGTDLPVITGFELIRSLRTQSINSETPVVFIADEVSGKSEYLAKALEVLGTLQRNSIDRDLAPLVTPMINEWKSVDVWGRPPKLSDN
ncbi:MAG TPA: response regulator [Cyclobacteriaceae bacterium]|nr:response regulator [Cyclobacteriaceae bacterium]